MARYKMVITNWYDWGEVRDTDSRDVMKLAKKYGRAQCGEKVFVCNRSGKVLACAIWSDEIRDYFRADMSGFVWDSDLGIVDEREARAYRKEV